MTSTTSSTKFRKWGDHNPVQQHFDREKIMLTKAGQTYNVYDAIQAANIDTDIVEVMKKYHCQQDDAVEFMKKRGGMTGIFADFAKMQEQAQSLPDIFALKQHSDELFANLPSDVREKYGNNLEEFFKDLHEKATELTAQKQAEQHAEKTKTNKSEVEKWKSMLKPDLTTPQQ